MSLNDIVARCVACKQRVGGKPHLKLKSKNGQKRALCALCLDAVKAKEREQALDAARKRRRVAMVVAVASVLGGGALSLLLTWTAR